MIFLAMQTYVQQSLTIQQSSVVVFHDPCMNVEIGKGVERAAHH